MYTNLFFLNYFQSTFVELIMMLYRADASSKQRLLISKRKKRLQFKHKTGECPEEKEEIEKNNEKLNQKIKKHNQRKKPYQRS